MSNWVSRSPILAPSVREDDGASSYVDVIWGLRSRTCAKDMSRMRKGREI